MSKDLYFSIAEFQKTINPICQAHNLGLIDYARVWDLQNRFAVEITAGERPPTLLLLEHPIPTHTGNEGMLPTYLG